jgi:hypothetical protein
MPLHTERRHQVLARPLRADPAEAQVSRAQLDERSPLDGEM